MQLLSGLVLASLGLSLSLVGCAQAAPPAEAPPPVAPSEPDPQAPPAVSSTPEQAPEVDPPKTMEQQIEGFGARRKVTIQRECDALMGVINQAAAAPEKAGTPAGPVQELNALADKMDRIVVALDSLNLKVAQLQVLRDRYKKMAMEVSAAARKTSDATTKRDAAKLAAGAKELEQATAQEDAIVADVNAFCAVK